MKPLLWCALLGVLLSPAAARAQADEVVYYHTDAIGSVRMITDATGTVLARYDFAPFGEKWDPQPNPDRLQFSGKERDTETGLDYFGARYYRPESGRFLSVDPKLGIEVALLDPQRWNRYSYVGNRPTRLIDPDGRGWASTLFKVGKALVKGEDVYSAVSGIVQDTSTIFSMDAGVGTGDRLLATGKLLIELSGAGDVAAGARGIASFAMRHADDSGNLSRIANFTERSATKGFMKHGEVFGITGNWNPKRTADFSRAVNSHINRDDVSQIAGTYRGMKAVHYLDPRSGVNVVLDQHGNYLTAYQLSKEQLDSVLRTGRLF